MSTKPMTDPWGERYIFLHVPYKYHTWILWERNYCLWDPGSTKLRMVMEPKYYAFRFGGGGKTSLAHHLGEGDRIHMFITEPEPSHHLFAWGNNVVNKLCNNSNPWFLVTCNIFRMGDGSHSLELLISS